jgi:hypothetical protein
MEKMATVLGMENVESLRQGNTTVYIQKSLFKTHCTLGVVSVFVCGLSPLLFILFPVCLLWIYLSFLYGLRIQNLAFQKVFQISRGNGDLRQIFHFVIV